MAAGHHLEKIDMTS